jgi:hypothetical protein
VGNLQGAGNRPPFFKEKSMVERVIATPATLALIAQLQQQYGMS